MQHCPNSRRKLQESVAVAAVNSTGDGCCGDGKIAGLYDLEETLGSGHFAVVKLARHVFTGAKVAVKVVDKTKLDEVSKAHLFQEVRCMKLVQHPNVVRLYEVIDTQSKLYLVLELGDGGDLYDYIMKHDGGLCENLARKYFRQILRAITYCHQLHVVHRDLKPENVVFFEKLGIVKLTDFGFSNKFSPGQKLETSCGSLAYSAPEILLGDSYDAPAVDVWSLGVILYMLVCGKPPFEKANDSETLTMIMDCKYSVPKQVTTACHKLIASMLVRDPKKRATLEQIASDPWLRDQTDQTDTNADYLPLVSREQISEDDHAFIIQKMISGNVSTKEDILQALDKDKYNHITATYFLLAEMRLRKRREELQLKQSPHITITKNLMPVLEDKSQAHTPTKTVTLPLNILCGSDALTGDCKSDKRSRKCSIVREEDEEESMPDLCGDSEQTNELEMNLNKRESLSDGRLNQSVQEHLLNNKAVKEKNAVSNADEKGDGDRNEMNIDLHVGFVPLKSKMLVSVDAALAHKLNAIEKDNAVINMRTINNGIYPTGNESLDIQDALRGLKELKLKATKNPVLTHHRRHSKLNKIRTPSCSSSEASDDDTKSRNKKKLQKFVGDTPTRFHMHRRDSHDDSSDSQEQGFPSTGPPSNDTVHLIASTNMSNNNNNNNNSSNRKDNQTQQTKTTDDTSRQKSLHSHQNQNQKSKTKQSNKELPSDKHHSLLEKTKLTVNLCGRRRRRIRESQSLDRITEAQEYDLRYQRSTQMTQIATTTTTTTATTTTRNPLTNLLQTFPETIEEYDIDSNNSNDRDVIISIKENPKSDRHLLNNNRNDRDVIISIKESSKPDRNSLNIISEYNNNHKMTRTEKASDDVSNYNLNYNCNTIEDIDLLMMTTHGRSLNKIIQTNESKCLITMRKLRKFGKYFPVMNLS